MKLSELKKIIREVIEESKSLVLEYYDEPKELTEDEAEAMLSDAIRLVNIDPNLEFYPEMITAIVSGASNDYPETEQWYGIYGQLINHRDERVGAISKIIAYYPSSRGDQAEFITRTPGGNKIYEW